MSSTARPAMNSPVQLIFQMSDTSVAERADMNNRCAIGELSRGSLPISSGGPAGPATCLLTKQPLTNAGHLQVEANFSELCTWRHKDE